MKTAIINVLLSLLFYPSPKIQISKEEEKQFEDLFSLSFKKPNILIEYNLSIPKYKFLHYLSQRKAIVFHGSNHKEIACFEPRQQTLFDGSMTTAVFATKDPIWSIFFAVLNKDKTTGGIRNGSISANGKRLFHFYSLTKPTLDGKPWTNGMIYLLPEDSFTHISKGTIQFSEWVSYNPVSPIAKIEVKPEDFYFLHKVSTHTPSESIIKSWLLYKTKTLFK